MSKTVVFNYWHSVSMAFFGCRLTKVNQIKKHIFVEKYKMTMNLWYAHITTLCPHIDSPLCKTTKRVIYPNSRDCVLFQDHNWWEGRLIRIFSSLQPTRIPTHMFYRDGIATQSLKKRQHEYSSFFPDVRSRFQFYSLRLESVIISSTIIYFFHLRFSPCLAKSCSFDRTMCRHVNVIP